MATYFIGDIQGCFDELQAILAKVDFSPSRDELWIVGDMVARGDKSLETLRYIHALEDAAKVVLGNHDLHLLALHNKLKRANPKDKLTALLNAPDIQQLVDWVRNQPLLRQHPTKKLVMSHAGIPPNWSIETALAQANEVSDVLKSDDYSERLIAKMYGNDIDSWHANLPELERHIYCVNALTRMRYLYEDGRLDFASKQPPEENTNPQIKPWFLYPRSQNNDYTLVFGHWAALMGKVNSPAFQALDTGCCWGERLTLWHLESNQKVSQDRLINA